MSKRIARVNQLIARELSKIILREIELPEDVLATITRVEASVDLHQAKAYISVMPETEKERVFQMLKGQIYQLQQLLNRRLKMRPIPKIEFVEEKNTVEAGRIEEILEKLKKEEK